MPRPEASAVSTWSRDPPCCWSVADQAAILDTVMTLADADRWETIKEILGAALDLPGAERAAFVARACGVDTHLRQAVESYLRADQNVSILERPLFSHRDLASHDVETVSDPGASTVSLDRLVLPEQSPYASFSVMTPRTRYSVVIVAPLFLELLVEGGARFPDRREAFLARGDTIAVGERMVLRSDGRIVTTGAVTAIRPEG